MSTTFLPAMAIVAARFSEMKVLPACGFDEVSRMVFSSRSVTFMNETLERRMRKASDTASRPVSRTITRSEDLSPCFGISPRNGALSRSSRSLRPRMEVSSMFSR